MCPLGLKSEMKLPIIQGVFKGIQLCVCTFCVFGRATRETGDSVGSSFLRDGRVAALIRCGQSEPI